GKPHAPDGARHPKKSGGLLRQGPRVKFAFIQTEKAAVPVTVLCRVLGVSRAGFYAAQRRPVPPRVTEDARLAVQIAAIHRASRRCYGSPRVHDGRGLAVPGGGAGSLLPSR